jgi:hypothetical protein
LSSLVVVEKRSRRIAEPAKPSKTEMLWGSYQMDGGKWRSVRAVTVLVVLWRDSTGEPSLR